MTHENCTKKVASLYIRNVPNEVAEYLRKEAKDRRMTLSGVLIDLVNKAKL